MTTVSRLAKFGINVAAMAAGTWFIGWWTVPVIAAVWAVADRTDRALPLRAAVAGLTAWALLLAVQLPGGSLERLAGAVGAAIGVGALPLVVLTLVYPALLAASAAGLVRAVTGAPAPDAAP